MGLETRESQETSQISNVFRPCYALLHRGRVNGKMRASDGEIKNCR